MPGIPLKKYKPEEIIAKLRQVDVLLSQGRPVAEAIRTTAVTPFACYCWRKEFGGLKSDQVKRLKESEKENERLRKAVSGSTESCHHRTLSTFCRICLSCAACPDTSAQEMVLEFVAKAVRDWITAVGARTAFIGPGSPGENGFGESSKSELRA